MVNPTARGVPTSSRREDAQAPLPYYGHQPKFGAFVAQERAVIKKGRINLLDGKERRLYNCGACKRTTWPVVLIVLHAGGFDNRPETLTGQRISTRIWSDERCLHVESGILEVQAL